jgi:hypothetical protein
MIWRNRALLIPGQPRWLTPDPDFEKIFLSSEIKGQLLLFAKDALG